ncbi:hypothetical protein [Simiduia agarivorans]|uniref:hypothetical protein n=1 Tax=Simiduia agarivorans TaxID=447471 RepID=UPI00146CC848|nr:hypothetical protein [Simiduia agarivorans]
MLSSPPCGISITYDESAFSVEMPRQQYKSGLYETDIGFTIHLGVPTKYNNMELGLLLVRREEDGKEVLSFNLESYSKSNGVAKYFLNGSRSELLDLKIYAIYWKYAPCNGEPVPDFGVRYEIHAT